jgi:hypothetical protein
MNKLELLNDFEELQKKILRLKRKLLKKELSFFENRNTSLEELHDYNRDLLLELNDLEDDLEQFQK